jgi:hypothetical protein
MIVNKEFVNFISFTQWVKKFLNFKPQGVASFTASAALYGFQHYGFQQSIPSASLFASRLVIQWSSCSLMTER